MLGVLAQAFDPSATQTSLVYSVPGQPAYRDIKNLSEKIKLHRTLVVPSDRTINNTFARVATEPGMKL